MIDWIRRLLNGDWSRFNHAHTSVATGGPLDAAAIGSGLIAPARLGSGTADATTFLRGDQTYAVPPGGGSLSATTVEVNLGATATWRGRFTITDAAIGATSKVMVWQACGPYTGKGTRADEAELSRVQVVCVEPAAGSCVVTWETPPIVVMRPQIPNGRRDAPSTAAGFDPRYPFVEITPTRLGKVRGNHKFSYVIAA